jgi:hypothetical protein
MFSSQNIQTEIDSLKKRVAILQSELNSPQLVIDEHCSEIIAKIDLKAETLIKKINEERLNLISEVQTYQKELLVN